MRRSPAGVVRSRLPSTSATDVTAHKHHDLRTPRGPAIAEQRVRNELRKEPRACLQASLGAPTRRMSNRVTEVADRKPREPFVLNGRARTWSSSDVDFDPHTVRIIDKNLRQRNLGPFARSVHQAAVIECLAHTNKVTSFEGNVVERAALAKPVIFIDEVQVHHCGVTKEQPGTRKAKVGAILGTILKPQNLFVEGDRLVGFRRVDVDVVEASDSHVTIVGQHDLATHESVVTRRPLDGPRRYHGRHSN